ncbi:MAG: 4Fe-4S binding protein [Bacteroidales bacterium]|nr:4Fe-4S binding protein [Bacteroidales bacterium]
MQLQKFLKPLRVAVEVATICLFAYIFFDFTLRAPENLFSALTWAQFVPSLLKCIFLTFGIAAGGFVLVLLLTLLFGRVYCSWICPLGMMKDFIYFIGKKIRPKRIKLRYSHAHHWLRYSILIIVILSALFTGTDILLEALDPYSNFGRFAADFGKPLFITLNNGLEWATRSLLPGFFTPEMISPIQWEALIFPALMLMLVTGLALFRGRLYCNTFCPVGSLLGAISHLSLFKIRISKSGCTRCGECMFACKSQCIDIKNMKVDFSRCVNCYNCIRACKNNSIGYHFCLSPQKENPVKINPEPDHSKRKFIAGAMMALPLVAFTIRRSGAQDFPVGNLSEEGKQKREAKASGGESIEENYKSGRNPVVRNHAVMPPGALSFEHFSQACTACHLCVSACTTGVLKPSFLEFGLMNMLKPHMDYDVNFCNYDCTKCSDICPNGALVKFSDPEKKKTTQIGIAEFHRENCIVETEHTSCGACAEHCPTQAVHMIPHGIEGLTIPRVEENLCIGCGACEFACPTRPYRAIFVSGNLNHQIAETPMTEKVEETSTSEFPF